MARKLFITFIIILTLVVLYIGYRFIKANYESSKTTSEKESADTQIQYRLAYNDVKGNMTQTIALNKGQALFEIKHRGQSQYSFMLFTPQGQLIAEIAQGSGDLDFAKSFDIPESTAYLLEVKTEGTWTFKYR
jgi:hypothetical protein